MRSLSLCYQYTEECVCSCQGVTAGSLCPLSQRDCDCWSVTSLSPALCPPHTHPPFPPPLQPGLPRYFACGPLFLPLSLFRSALHMGLVSHGNLLSPIRSSPPAGLPHRSSIPPLWPCHVALCPSSVCFTLQHPTIRASLTPVITPSRWARHPRRFWVASSDL